MKTTQRIFLAFTIYNLAFTINLFAQKEVFETHYWIRLLRDSEYINEVIAQELLNDCEELQRIITSILVKSKSNQ